MVFSKYKPGILSRNETDDRSEYYLIVHKDSLEVLNSIVLTVLQTLPTLDSVDLEGVDRSDLANKLEDFLFTRPNAAVDKQKGIVERYGSENFLDEFLKQENSHPKLTKGEDPELESLHPKLFSSKEYPKSLEGRVKLLEWDSNMFYFLMEVGSMGD